MSAEPTDELNAITDLRALFRNAWSIGPLPTRPLAIKAHLRRLPPALLTALMIEGLLEISDRLDALESATASIGRPTCDDTCASTCGPTEPDRNRLNNAEIVALRAEVTARETRRIEILDWLQDEIGTAWTCDHCGYSTYHANANECVKCGVDFPVLNMLAFKLHATHPNPPLPTTPAPKESKGD
jgi:hypothetical protein